MPNPANVTGTDGHVPILDTTSAFRIWAYDQIYIGQEAEGKYVPKPLDWVVNRETKQWFEVVSIDPTTFIPVLRRNQVTPESGDFTDIDVFLGVGPGTPADTYKIYLDTSVIPHAMAIDQRLWINGSMSRYIKVFRGSEVGNTLEVVSALYDASGNLLGNDIPLELARIPNHQNYATYSVPPFKTMKDLPDGEILTGVVYSDTGHVVSKRQFIVERTGFIPSVTDDLKYISHISLESPWISDADPKLINYPMNVPVNGLNLIGVVHYSNGSTLKMGVDGNKFAVFGLDGFVATVIGQELPVVIRYTLAANEVVYGASIGQFHHLSESYRAKTVKAKGSHTPKLYGYPVWVDGVNGYRLQWFMYNLDRRRYWDVTGQIVHNANTPAFNPTLYGVNQRLSVSLNMKNVDGTLDDFIFTTTQDVVLTNQGTEAPTNWTIGFDPGQNPPFGVGNFVSYEFVNQNLKRVKLGAGAANLTEWLERFYYRTRPLIDPTTEAIPPMPDLFALIIGNQEIEFPIGQWNDELAITQNIPNLSTLFIKFYRRTPDNDLQLTMTGVPVHYV